MSGWIYLQILVFGNWWTSSSWWSFIPRMTQWIGRLHKPTAMLCRQEWTWFLNVLMMVDHHNHPVMNHDSWWLIITIIVSWWQILRQNNLGKMVGSTGQPFSSMIGKVDLESFAIATQFLGRRIMMIMMLSTMGRITIIRKDSHLAKMP